MKRIYEAANNIEAHMLVHLLEQAGIEAHVQGEHLQSGGGELPLGGLVAVAVEDEDAEAATRIIREWESRTAAPADPQQMQSSSRAFFAPMLAFIVGSLLGAGFVWSLHHGPDTKDGHDWNGDGKLDEHAYFDGETVERVEYDRNFDGRIDAIERYDLAGLLSAFESDDDFDGRLEGLTRYRGREPQLYTVDANGDGEVDYRERFEFGALSQAEYLNGDGQVVKRVEYRGFKAQRVQLDLDGDGEWERTYQLDRYDEAVGR